MKADRGEVIAQKEIEKLIEELDAVCEELRSLRGVDKEKIIATDVPLPLSPFFDRLERYKSSRPLTQWADHSIDPLDTAVGLLLGGADRAMTQLRTMFARLPYAKESTKWEVGDRLLQGRLYMDQHFCTQISVEDIAKQASLSTYHFLRLFRTVYDVTPYQYLSQKRLDKAKHLLLETTYSIERISEQCAFSSAIGFTQFFTRSVGVSPSLFRHMGGIPASDG